MLRISHLKSAFSIVELMISAALMSGIFYTGSLMVQNQEQAQRKISLGIERNTAFNLIGKLLEEENRCNSLLKGLWR